MDVLLALLLFGAVAQPVQVQKPVDLTEKNCLAANIYYEARGESLKGQQAVAAVTLNRVKSKKYPKTICGVVTQKAQFSWVHQQPEHVVKTALKGLPPSRKPLEVQAYYQAQKVAHEAIKSGKQVLPEQVLYYHTNQVNPVWNRKMIRVQQIGAHLFWKENS